MNPDLDRLQPYPFQRLRTLFEGASPPSSLSDIRLSIGEPQHAAPEFVARALADNLDLLSRYPATAGSVALRESIANWLCRRFKLQGIDADQQVLPVNGTREALFALAQAVVSRDPGATVICPNPFYQIYEGAALLAGATPVYVDCRPELQWLPDFEAVTDDQWRNCQLLYLCSPGNPTGAVIPLETLKWLIERAREFDFVIASDECYSELYPDENQAPPGLLQACAELGDNDYRQCVVFHSLSKRSNLPGLRSGFVAGDADILARFLTYRTYHGCAMPLHHQLASQVAWDDESHVIANRALYREKFARVLAILGDALPVSAPDAGFYLWPQTPISDVDFSRALYESQHVTVLPGSFLGREAQHGNPGANHIRMALVAPLASCEEAARRIVQHIEQY